MRVAPVEAKLSLVTKGGASGASWTVAAPLAMQ
jgi:hypothetical protein